MKTLARRRREFAAGLALAVAAALPAPAQDYPGSGPIEAAPWGYSGGSAPGFPSPSYCPSCGEVHLPSRHAAKKINSKHWRWLQANALGYPDQFVPRPLGASLYQNNMVQVANGAAARMVLYNYDFVDGTSQLSVRGRDQLAKVASRLPWSPVPIIIERMPYSPGLAESRRYAVLAALAGSPYPVTSDRVVVGPPIAAGIGGAQAELIDQNFLGRVGLTGPPLSLSPTTGAGAGTGTSVAPPASR